MGKSPNGKPSRKKNSRTRRKQRKRWKRRKNRNKRAKQPTARSLEWFPSISNDLPTVASAWWNALTVEECVRSPRSRASSGSKRTPERRAADPFDSEALVGHRKNGLGHGWRITDERQEPVLSFSSSFATHPERLNCTIRGRREKSRWNKILSSFAKKRCREKRVLRPHPSSKNQFPPVVAMGTKNQGCVNRQCSLVQAGSSHSFRNILVCSISVNFDCGKLRFELMKFSIGQLYIGSAQILLDSLRCSGTRNRHDTLFFVQYPRKRNLCGGCTFLVSKIGQYVQ